MDAEVNPKGQAERADKWLDRTMQRTDELADAIDVIAHIVSQANVNPVTATDQHGGYIARYDMPVGSIHKAIAFLQRFGVSVDRYGGIHKGPNCPVREPTSANASPDRSE